MAQLVEHIVHIDGVTGSSPVATTTNPWKYSISEGFLFARNAPSPLRVREKVNLIDFKIRTLFFEGVQMHLRGVLR